MMDAMTVGELLKDFRSIKLPKHRRELIDKCRELFESIGTLPNEQRFALFDLAKRYNRQFRELYDARARARRTRGLRAMGITRGEASQRVVERKRQEELRRSDVGF
jgi:hypothetical protein